jgi:hypothetical protein
VPGPDGVIAGALDFDGSLVEEHVLPFRWRAGAREFVVAAAAAGLRLVLYSCRTMPVSVRELPGDADEFWRAGRVPADAEKSWALREEMVAFLKAEGVWGCFLPWEEPGKPLVDWFADDRFEKPDWIVLAGELGVRLVHGDRSPEPPTLGERPVPLPGTVIAAAGAAGAPPAR